MCVECACDLQCDGHVEECECEWRGQSDAVPAVLTGRLRSASGEDVVAECTSA